MERKTSAVSGRRTLRFENLHEAVADAERLAAGPVRSLGNWSLAQCLRHLTLGVRMAWDGPPFVAPWYLRFLAPLLKNRFLTKPMSAGFRLPKSGAKLLPTDDVETAAELAAFRQAVDEFYRVQRSAPHGLFGKLTEDEWEQIECRHCELHLSFQLPAANSA